MMNQPQLLNRQRAKEELAKRAIAAAMKSNWSDAAKINTAILQDFPQDVEAYNRLGKALAAEGNVRKAKDAFSQVLKLSPHNPIALKNFNRLNQIIDDKPIRINTTDGPRKAFIAESGKATITSLVNLDPAKEFLKEAPGHLVNLKLEAGSIQVHGLNNIYLGQIEPRLGARLTKLIRGGNKYDATITSIGAFQVEIIIRETFQHSSQLNVLSFPSKATANINSTNSILGPDVVPGKNDQKDMDTAKDWSSDDTEPGDDEAFTPIIHRIINPDEDESDEDY